MLGDARRWVFAKRMLEYRALDFMQPLLRLLVSRHDSIKKTNTIAQEPQPRSLLHNLAASAFCGDSKY